MNEKLYKILEFNKILEYIQKFSKSEISKKRIGGILPYTNKNNVQNELIKTEQALKVIRSIGSIPIAPFYTVDDSVLKAQKGGVLSIFEFWELKRFLKICSNVLKYFTEDILLNLDIDLILAIVSYLNIDIEFLKELEKIFLDSEQLSDNASGELMRLRREIKGLDSQIISTINSILNNPNNKKYLSDIMPAMKNQRLTIPVKAEYKDMIRGTVHDISSTGATYFIEPEKAFNMNNKLKELQLKELQEIEKILSELSARVSVMAEDLFLCYDALINLDIIFAKAEYASELNAICPILTDDGNTALYSARHPLINKTDVVASDIVFNDNYSIVIITGPNTGGKTVALKTLGILQLMAQSGIMIPAKEYSKINVFEKIYADIGDEQSIEQSLSTFSSHMKNLIDILNDADENTLILIDEIGAGTDPVEGAALGMAIIDTLLQKKSKALVSTHYSELKKYALIKREVVNASVEFDVDTLRPTYKLIIGLPGESNAIKIAQRLGLQDNIITDAKKYLSNKDESFENILQKIKEKQTEIEKNAQQIRYNMIQSEEYLKKTKEKEEKIAKEKEQLIKNAKSEAYNIILQAKAQSNTLVDELIHLKKESNIDLKQAEAVKKELKELGKEFEKSETINTDNENLNNRESYNIGDSVFIKHLNAHGVVHKLLNKNEAEVVVGSMRLKFNTNLLEKDNKKKQSSFVSLKRQNKHISTSIDVRGMDSIDAIKAIDKYIDDATISSYKSVMIIHGKGEGILRKQTLEFLKHNPNVRSFRAGGYSEGGTGVTVVDLF
jgi:DNA mismatch repair protein MutS2